MIPTEIMELAKALYNEPSLPDRQPWEERDEATQRTYIQWAYGVRDRLNDVGITLAVVKP